MPDTETPPAEDGAAAPPPAPEATAPKEKDNKPPERMSDYIEEFVLELKEAGKKMNTGSPPFPPFRAPPIHIIYMQRILRSWGRWGKVSLPACIKPNWERSCLRLKKFRSAAAL